MANVEKKGQRWMNLVVRVDDQHGRQLGWFHRPIPMTPSEERSQKEWEIAEGSYEGCELSIRGLGTVQFEIPKRAFAKSQFQITCRGSFRVDSPTTVVNMPEQPAPVVNVTVNPELRAVLEQEPRE